MAGGGVRVPITPRLAGFPDLRFGIQGELDSIRFVLPLRAGMAWHF